MIIKEIRKSLGLTGQDMSDYLHISLPHYYDLENGKKRIHAELLFNIAKKLGVSPNDLYGSRISELSKETSRNIKSFKLARELEREGVSEEKIRAALKFIKSIDEMKK